jgi:hypothetical protein
MVRLAAAVALDREDGGGVVVAEEEDDGDCCDDLAEGDGLNEDLLSLLFLGMAAEEEKGLEEFGRRFRSDELLSNMLCLLR